MTSPGDLLAANYQWQLHETLYGAGSNSLHWQYGKTIEGLGVPDAKTQDIVYNLKDGSYANPDYLSVRQILIPAMVRATTETAAMTALKALTLAWVSMTTDTDLAFQLPGWGKFYVNGRPRGAKVDLTNERQGVVWVMLRFDCPNPTITYL